MQYSRETRLRLAARKESRNINDSREQNIIGNLGLVSYVFRHLVASEWIGLDFEDAFESGIEGLIQAVDRYDQTSGTAFASYAINRIRGSILDASRQADPLSRPMRKLVREAENTKWALAATLGRLPKPGEIAALLEVPSDKLEFAISRGGFRTTSLDRLRTQGNEDDHTGRWEPTDIDPTGNPEFAVDLIATNDILVDAICSLTTRDQQIILLRYQEEKSIADIAEILQISESRVCQLLKRIIAKLRNYWRDELEAAA